MNESAELLRGHFDLTPSEARLVLRLVAGDKLRSAAVKLDISYETARGHLKNIFNKTGVRRQTELVVLIVTALPACLEASRSRRKLRQPPPNRSEPEGRNSGCALCEHLIPEGDLSEFILWKKT